MHLSPQEEESAFYVKCLSKVLRKRQNKFSVYLLSRCCSTYVTSKSKISTLLNMTINKLPKIIWIIWFQGLEGAPDVVKCCYASWIEKNPGWKIILITDSNYKDYFDLDSAVAKERISIQERSNILRMGLLAEHGGVWVDATCFCSVPLDSWIHNYTKSGFFIFRDPGEDRIISNWFIASVKNQHLTKSFNMEYSEYFKDNKFLEPVTSSKRLLLKKIAHALNRKGRTDIWFSYLVRKVFRVYPYFVFHYYFAYHIKHDSASRKIFNDIPYFGADKPHEAQKLIKQGLRVDKIRKAVEMTSSPVHKLTHKDSAFTKEILHAVFSV